VDKRQRERFFGVGDAPIVTEITAGNVRGIEEHRLERGVESAGIGYVGRRSVGRRRRGVILGHGGDLYFIYLFWVSRRSIFRREGGKNGSLTVIVEAIKIYNCLFYVGNEYIFIGR